MNNDELLFFVMFLKIQLMEKRGGNNPNQVVHRIIGYLVTDDLLLEFTFHGHKDKKGFKQTAVMECVYGRVKSLKMHNKTSHFFKIKFQYYL